MPTWSVIVVGIAGTIVAFGVIWSRALKPLARFVDRDLPILEELTDAFANSSGAFAVLNEIQAQFRTNSGSTLRDAINRLEAALLAQDVKAKGVAVEAVGIETLAGKDRDRLADVVYALEDIQAWVRQQRSLDVVTPAAEATKVTVVESFPNLRDEPNDKTS